MRQPERLDDFEPEVDTVVVAAYGVLIPDALLDRALWLNVHPSLLPRWRGAAPIERALMAGDDETGVTIIELVARARRRADRGAAGVPARAGGRLRHGLGARRASSPPSCSSEVLPEPALRPQPEEGVTYAEKIRPEDRELDWTPPAAGAAEPDPGALAAHRRARRAARPARDDLARAGRGRRARAVEVQPDGGRRMGYDEFLRGLR